MAKAYLIVNLNHYVGCNDAYDPTFFETRDVILRIGDKNPNATSDLVYLILIYFKTTRNNKYQTC